MPITRKMVAGRKRILTVRTTMQRIQAPTDTAKTGLIIADRAKNNAVPFQNDIEKRKFTVSAFSRS